MRFTEMNSPGRQPKVFYGKRQSWQSDKYLWLSEEKGLCDSQNKVLFYSITFSVIVVFLDGYNVQTVMLNNYIPWTVSCL